MLFPNFISTYTMQQYSTFSMYVLSLKKIEKLKWNVLSIPQFW